ncbi:hypothetical protein NGM37_37630, partial [Streptomyces sp. TRM76130]|nr:hypothetical protein [Streptomyces sp. TRM76130]
RPRPDRVLPADAGVLRGAGSGCPPRGSSLRRRGGAPAKGMESPRVRMFSPPTRGCSAGILTQRHFPEVLPADAGVLRSSHPGRHR